MNWEEAEAGLKDADRGGRGLQFAIELWRNARREELRRLVDGFEKAGDLAPLKSTGAEGLQDWTRAFVESPLPVPRAHFEHLAALVAAATPKVAKLALGFVAQQQADPRFAAFLSSMARTNRALLDTPTGINEFCRALLQHADTGHRKLLASLQGSAAMKLRHVLAAKMKFLAKVPAPPRGWGEAKAASSASGQASGHTDEAALWTQVYERPEDLSVRAVLSDLLIERGDPRGPFIAAQLAGDTTQPPMDLVGAFLGPIAGVLRPESVRFARGFPVSGLVNGSIQARKIAVALLQREWATFESLQHLERLAPTLRSLTSAPGLSQQGADEWIKKRWKVPLIHVGLPFSAVDRAARLPTALDHLSLRHLYVRAQMDLSPLFDSLRAVTTLRTLSFGSAMLRVEKPSLMFTSELGDAWPVWTEQARTLPSLQTITWDMSRASFELVSEQQRFDTLRVVLSSHFRPGDRAALVAQALRLVAVTPRVRLSATPHTSALGLALERAGFQVVGK